MKNSTKLDWYLFVYALHICCSRFSLWTWFSISYLFCLLTHLPFNMYLWHCFRFSRRPRTIRLHHFKHWIKSKTEMWHIFLGTYEIFMKNCLFTIWMLQSGMKSNRFIINAGICAHLNQFKSSLRRSDASLPIQFCVSCRHKSTFQFRFRENQRTFRWIRSVTA